MLQHGQEILKDINRVNIRVYGILVENVNMLQHEKELLKYIKRINMMVYGALIDELVTKVVLETNMFIIVSSVLNLVIS